MDLAKFYSNSTFAPSAQPQAAPSAPAVSPAAPRSSDLTMAQKLFGGPGVTPPVPPPAPAATQAQAPEAAPSAVAPTKPEPVKEGPDLAKLFENTVPQEYSLSIPDGYEHLGLQLEPVQLAEFTAIAKGMGLTNSKAQALLALHAKAVYGAPKVKK